MRISGVIYAHRKTHKIRNFLVFCLILILLSALVLVSISAYESWKLLHPRKLPLEAFASNIVPEYTDVAFSSSDQKTSLSGWYFRSKDSAKTVILAHSYGLNRLQFGQQTLELIKQFLSAGYNVLAPDFRNSGKSGGNMTTLGYHEKQDLLAAVSKAKSLGAKHIILMGFSTGASTALLTAAESPEVTAVIADSPYGDIREYLNCGLGTQSLPDFPFDEIMLASMHVMAGIKADAVSPDAVIRNIAPRPVFLIHGADDKAISVDSSRTLQGIYASSGSNQIKLWEVENADHLGSYEKDPVLYREKVLEFLDGINWE